MSYDKNMLFIDISKQRDALVFMDASGSASEGCLQTIWKSDDLAVMRDALRLFPQMPMWWRSRFESAIKQMSG